MTYLSWGAFYEGESDAAYFGVLIPRIIQEIILVRGTRHVDVPADPALRLRRGSVDVSHERHATHGGEPPRVCRRRFCLSQAAMAG